MRWRCCRARQIRRQMMLAREGEDVLEITGFTAWLVENDPGPKFIWRDGLPGSWGDIPKGSKPRKAVVRMETDTGLFGAYETVRGDAVVDLVERRYHEFIGENPLLTERMWRL